MVQEENVERKRIADLEEDGSLERVELLMPSKMLEELKREALEKDVSRASIVREALSGWFREKKIPETNPEAVISDKDLKELLGAR